LRAVRLDGLLRRPSSAATCLLILPENDEGHDFALAERQGLEAILEERQELLVMPAYAVAVDGSVDGVDELLIIEGLAEHLDGPRPSSRGRPPDVRVAGNENQRQVGAVFGEHTLSVEPAHAWHPHVHDDAPETVAIQILEELVCGP
jgi:hypothetical protein